MVALKTAPVTAVNPKGAEIEISQAATPKRSGTAATKQAPAQTAAAATTSPDTSAQLPKTASNLPLILLVGVVSLGLSLSLLSLAKRIG